MFAYIRNWLPLAVGLTGLCIVVYASGQQVYRQSLNDPQIQIVQDMAARIASGASATSTVSKSSVDIAASLSTFVVVYDGSGKPIVSSGLLDGKIPVPPPGVFAYASSNTDDRLTLEPEPGVRIAAVVKAIPQGKGFVLAGRNMRVVETRISDLGNMLLLGWIVLMIATFATTVISKKYMRDQNGYIRMNL
jgi:hypothetical protein